MNEHYKFVNPPLSYSYDALEPFIDAKTMHLHHDKHLQTYIDNLNRTLEDYPDLQTFSLEELILNTSYYPESIHTTIQNNAGGVYNHIFYFSNLTDSGSRQPVGRLAEYINWTFGSFENFKKQLISAALSVFGSGYAWLVSDNKGMLRIITTANQDTPLPQNLCPILNLDVWEHAYYLKHYNVRADYLNDWFHVVNWEQANQTFDSHCLL